MRQLHALIQPILDEIAALEKVFRSLESETILDSATGKTLELIGESFNVFRRGLSDPNYRAAIWAKLSQYASKGRAEDLIECAQRITLGDKIWCEDGAGNGGTVYIYTNGRNTEPYRAAMDAVAGSGVRVNLQTWAGKPLFTFSNGNNSAGLNAMQKGFNDGYWAGA